jgi:3-methylfumaryl-CoA hydratase
VAQARLRTFTFRALKPLFDTAAFATCGLPDQQGRAARLWTRDVAGAVTMQAEATW